MSEATSGHGSPRVRRARRKAKPGPIDPAESYKAVEHIYRSEESRQRSLVEDKEHQRTQKQALAAEIRQVVTQLTESLHAKSSLGRKVRPLPTDLPPNSVFREPAVDIEEALQPQEKLSKFGQDPNAFFVYKQRSGFVKIAGQTPTPRRHIALRGTIRNLLEAALPPVTSRTRREQVPKRRREKLRLPRLRLEARHGSIDCGNGGLDGRKRVCEGRHDMSCVDPEIEISIFGGAQLVSGKTTERRPAGNPDLTNVSVLNSFIEKCGKEEREAGANLRTCEKKLRIARALADNYREVSKRVEAIDCAQPEALKEMFFEKVREERDLEAEVEKIIFNYRNSPTNRMRYNMMYPLVKRFRAMHKRESLE